MLSWLLLVKPATTYNYSAAWFILSLISVMNKQENDQSIAADLCTWIPLEVFKKIQSSVYSVNELFYLSIILSLAEK